MTTIELNLPYDKKYCPSCGCFYLNHDNDACDFRCDSEGWYPFPTSEYLRWVEENDNEEDYAE